MNSWFIRRANVVYSAGGRLPAGFTELDYLESNGNQYINTGIVPTSATDVSVTLKLGTVNSRKYIMGRYASSAQYFLYVTNPSSSYIYQWGWSCGYKNSSTVVDALKHTFRLYSNGTTSYLNIDGSDVDSKTTANQSGGTLPFTLFRGGDSSVGSGYSQRVYGCVIKNSGTTVMELVPAKRNADDVVGMYDLVSDTFLTNAGSGSFSYGEL